MLLHLLKFHFPKQDQLRNTELKLYCFSKRKMPNSESIWMYFYDLWMLLSHVMFCVPRSKQTLIGLEMGNHLWLLQSRLEHKCLPIFHKYSYSTGGPQPWQWPSCDLPYSGLKTHKIIEILSNRYGNSPKYYYCYFFFQTNSRSSTLFWANDFQLGPWGGWGGLIISWFWQTVPAFISALASFQACQMLSA